MNENVPLKGFSDYFFENIAVKNTNQLQITSICNANCIFCSNDQNPFDIKRCGFRPLEEIEKVIWSMHNVEGPIMLNESLPGRLSEGEAFLHPAFFQILKAIRTKFNNVIKITTNGSLLTPDFISQLKEYNPLEISISIPTINKTYWKESFNLNDDHYTTALHSFVSLTNNNIRVLANVVPMPSWLGWEDLEKTFAFLSINVKHIIIYAPGYTKRSKVVDKLVYDKLELSLFLENMSRKYSFTYSWVLDPRNVLSINYDLIINNIWFVYNKQYRNILWLTSTAARDRFETLLKGLSVGIPVNNVVLEVKNITYGGNIECVGLWTIQDLDGALVDYLNNHPTPNQIFIPGGFLDRYGFDLCGDNILDLIKKYDGISIGVL
jgi:uncharacterized Fe-S cluster-containing radical SAM superfamily protein